MPSSQLKRAERAIEAIRNQSELPPAAAGALQELVDAVRAIESRVMSLEGKKHPNHTRANGLPNL
jgi:hypothetical protein